MLKQYRQIQAEYPEHIILFQCGDFFEIFDEAARHVSRILEIALCESRYGAPMTGVPIRSLDTHLERLVKNRISVVLVEQQQPEAEKIASNGNAGRRSLVIQRRVTRIITPGTLTEENLLESRANNFILSLLMPPAERMAVGLAWIDLSTGFFRVLQIASCMLYEELLRINPSEIILSGSASGDGSSTQLSEALKRYRAGRPECYVVERRGLEATEGGGGGHGLLTEYFGNEHAARFTEGERQAANQLLRYVQATQLERRPYIEPPQRHNRHASMQIDAAALRSLEILRNSSTNTRENSLLDVLDVTCTAAGSRALIQRLQSPLTSIQAIEARLDAAQFFLEAPSLTGLLREHLKVCKDLERSFQRLALNRSSGGPRDMAAIWQTLQQVSIIRGELQTALAGGARQATIIEQLVASLDGCPELVDVLRRALQDQAPSRVSEGNVIREGFSPKLDGLRKGYECPAVQAERLRERYQRETGKGKGLNVLKRRSLGWVLELSRSEGELQQANRFIMESRNERRTRYRTVELELLNRTVASTNEEIIQEEMRIYEELRSTLVSRAERIMRTAKAMAELDMTLSVAVLAKERRFARPRFTNGSEFFVSRGRHPVVEYKHLESSRTFVHNSCDLGPHGRFALITGPNMGGKSTFLRQNALISIMAQCGMYVPADECVLGIVDAVFTRIGASDDLSRDRSTFMVEMIETASILSSATARSLVIMDEIGRGTSAREGLALARGICQFLYEQVSCRTLFATHYAELAPVVKSFAAGQCLMTAARLEDGHLYFLHQLFPGVAAKSYAIEIARLAGIPEPVLHEAASALAAGWGGQRMDKLDKMDKMDRMDSVAPARERQVLT